jgi:hypothetical protein
MEHRHDYLMLRNGNKFRIPFDAMLLFSTNMQPSEVADEAFLRRIGYKIFVGEVTVEDYRRILHDVCDAHEVPYTDAHTSVQGCTCSMHGRCSRHPCDLVGQVADYATYHGFSLSSRPRCHWHSTIISQPKAARCRREKTS